MTLIPKSYIVMRDCPCESYDLNSIQHYLLTVIIICYFYFQIEFCAEFHSTTVRVFCSVIVEPHCGKSGLSPKNSRVIIICPGSQVWNMVKLIQSGLDKMY